MALAGKILGAASPGWQRLEAICQEYLGAHPAEMPADGACPGVLHFPMAQWLESAKEALEEETERWAFLEKVDPVEAPASAAADGEVDPRRLDEELRLLVAMEGSWDELVGHLGMLLLMLGLWRDMKFASFGQYCAERLGMAARTIEQRAWLERRFYSLPGLREAMREGRVSYEKARLIARCADDTAPASRPMPT